MTESRKAIFISYASEDSEVARHVCETLRAAGIEVWFDKSELRGGDAWDHRIRHQISDCALFVPIISAHTQARSEGYFRLEWDLADQRSHMIARSKAFIIPVCVDDTPERGAEVPESFLKAQWTRMPDGAAAESIVERISSLSSTDERDPAARSTELSARPVSATALGKPSGNSRAHWRSRPVRTALIACVLIGGGYLAADTFMLRKRIAEVGAPQVSQSTVPAGAEVSEKSIAVLPFVDMSEKKDQEYFADGLSEELIDLLAQVQDLRVPARTSSFYFKGQHATIAEVAKALGVSHVLEGSVRRSGNALRVTVQLIRADNGYHLWSHTFDRELIDVFKMQDEIAEAVVTALKAKLGPGQRFGSSGGTNNVEAYDQYLLGKQFFFRDNVDGHRRAAAAFRQAIALDPNYAVAYAWLAACEHHLVGIDEPDDRQALAHVEKAVSLAPQLAEVYSARGLMRYWHRDWSGAQADIEKALALDPGDSDSLRRYGILLASLGRLPDAIVAQKRSIEIDPLNGSSWSYLADYYTATGQHALARGALNRALDLAPDADYRHWSEGVSELLQGRASRALASFRLDTGPETRLAGVAMAEHTLGHDQEAQQALHELIDKYGRDSPYTVAIVFAWRNERAAAIDWLERAVRDRDEDVVIVKYDPLLDNLRGEPRFKTLLRTMKLPE